MALNKEVLSEGFPMGYIKGLSNEFYRRVFQWVLSEGCPMNVIEGLSNDCYQRVVQ